MIELWNTLASAAQITLNPAQHDLLSRYLDLLLQANQTMNLTRISERGAAEEQHVGDALTLLPFLPAGAIKVADVGSGGGVPGIPLAIVRPDLQIVLIESTKKKAAFLERTVAELGLSRVRVRSERAEEIARSDRRETFDVVVARAVALLDQLVDWCLPLVRGKGKFLAMKGKRAAEELATAGRAIRRAGGGEPIVHPAPLPGADGHVIIEIPKVRKAAYY